MYRIYKRSEANDGELINTRDLTNEAGIEYYLKLNSSLPDDTVLEFIEEDETLIYKKENGIWKNISS